MQLTFNKTIFIANFYVGLNYKKITITVEYLLLRLKQLHNSYSC